MILIFAVIVIVSPTVGFEKVISEDEIDGVKQLEFNNSCWLLSSLW